MIRKKGNGAGQSAAEIICLDHYRQSNSHPEKPQAPYAEKIAEDAWLRAKREYIENPTDANFWAAGILERAFFLMYGGTA